MSEFSNKSKTELTKMLADKRTALQTFRFNMAGSKSKNVKEGKALKKDIARILTQLHITKA